MARSTRSSDDRGKTFTCVFCGERCSEDYLRYQDELRSLPVCPDCFEPNGGELARELARADAASLAASLTTKHLQPPKEPGWFDPTTVPCIASFSSKPITLTRGGAAVELTLTGTFTTSDTFTYGDAEITDSVAPAITDEDTDRLSADGIYDQVVLTVLASGSATLGLTSLTHTSGDYSDTYKNVFDVRD